MLSRIAESLFWIGRYVERADDTSRIVDAYVQRLLQNPWIDEVAACRSLLEILGVPVPPDLDGTQMVINLLAFDATNPSAITGAWNAARENARGARETVSSELWQALNSTWHNIPGQRERARRMGPNTFLTYVRERAAVVNGFAESSMSHDEGWSFLVLGRSLERADMTARLLATRIVDAEHSPSWSTLLRACGADQMFVRTYRGQRRPEDVAEFLLLDRLFPRSVVCALETAEARLLELGPGVERAGVGDPARRVIGRTRTGLEYVDRSHLLSTLPDQLAVVQSACHEASLAVAARYFQYAAAVPWEHEGA